MKVWLLYENSESGGPSSGIHKNEVIQDLNLDIIFKTMARKDNFIYKTVRSVLLNSLNQKEAIQYRQDILMDALEHTEVFEELYQIASKTVEDVKVYTESKKQRGKVSISNAVDVMDSLELLTILVNSVETLKGYLDTVEESFQSKGMGRFYERLCRDYNLEFGKKIKSSIYNMNFLTEGGQITFSASLGQGLKMQNLIVNRIEKYETKKKNKYFEAILRLYYKFFKRNIIVLEDNEVNHNTREMEAAGLAHILKMYRNFIKELLSYFENLRYQIAFYLGCVNLRTRFDQLFIPTCMPEINDEGENQFCFEGLYDMSMAIYSRKRPVTNTLNIIDKQLYLITGANQGGKSTYLRSIGIAQLLMQCGMFVPANSYRSNLYDGIYTHFTRREDQGMNSGKLDEELARISQIITHIQPKAMLLMNESFATTTEREGSQIASDVVHALYESNITILLVTHLFEFTKSMYEKQLDKSIFLSAERLEDGTRTFRILEKEPEQTSYGLDLYHQIIQEGHGDRCDVPRLASNNR